MSKGYRIPSDYKNDVSKYTHNWKSPAFFTMHPGLAYVTHHRHLNTGDRIRGDLSQLVQSQPMVGPLMQGFRLITIATFTPDSIIYGWMRNGIRYSPQDYMKFDKWYFNPVTSSSNAPAAGASFMVEFSSSDSEKVFSLQPGLITGNTADTDAPYFYRAWLSDSAYIDSSDSSSGALALSSVGRGGLWDCLGLPPGSVYPYIYDVGDSSYKPLPQSSWDLSIAPAVAYFLSFYYYLANMQEDRIYFTRGVYTLTKGSSTVSILPPGVSNLGFEDAFVSVDPNYLLSAVSSLASLTFDGFVSGSSSSMNIFDAASTVHMDVLYGWLMEGFQAHGGLFSVPYRPDFFNNIIKVGDAPSISVPVTTDEGSNDSVAIPDLRYYTKLQNAMDRIFVSGGRFGDMLRTLFGTNSNPYTNKPDFLGVWQSTLNPTNTVALAAGEADGESSVPGQMTARVDSYSDFGGRKIDYYAKEPGTVLFVSFLVPMPAYSQGLHPDLAVTTFADDFNPEMKGLGFSSVPRWRYSMLPRDFSQGSVWTSGQTDGSATDPNLAVVGDTVAWDWLKTDYPRLHGEFATNGYFEYWTLKRDFTEVWTGADTGSGVVSSVNVGEYYGTYINPLAWQYIFVAQSLLDPNFFVGFNFNLKVTSSVPANYMPYLGR